MQASKKRDIVVSNVVEVPIVGTICANLLNSSTIMNMTWYHFDYDNL